jgi:hypothetical protein
VSHISVGIVLKGEIMTISYYLSPRYLALNGRIKWRIEE